VEEDEGRPVAAWLRDRAERGKLTPKKPIWIQDFRMTRYAAASRAGLSCALLLALALGGCSFFSHNITWSKPGVTDAQAQDDLASCTEQAQVQTDRDVSIDQDIAAADTASSSPVDTSPLQSMQNYKHQNRFRSVLKDCMSQLGYHEAD
jgi:hypothetical protein